MSADEIQIRIETMLEPICEELNLELYDVEVKPSTGEGLVRVILERRDASGPGTGITMDELTNVTRQLNYLLDVDDFISFSYRLEVSSPGVERDLTRPSHYERHIGDQVRVVLREATPDGRIVLKGTLVSFDGLSAQIECEDGVQREALLDVVKRARTVYDFSMNSPKPKKGQGARRNNDSGNTGES